MNFMPLRRNIKAMNRDTEKFFKQCPTVYRSEKTITSPKNPRIKQVLKLRVRSHRDKDALMLIEGKTELKRALANGIRPTSLFYCIDGGATSDNSEIIGLCRKSGAEIFSCSPGVFQKIAYRNQPEGIIAIAPQFKLDLEQLRLSSNPLIIVAESIEKPGNLGAILRSADAAGAEAVIACDHCTDIYNPNVIRAGIGTLFSVPVIEAESSAALAWLRRNGIRIFAATPHAETEYINVDFSGGCAIVTGEEHGGLSHFWMREADMKVRIPMLGQADSLNVAAATTILLFEAVRQRGKDRKKSDKQTHTGD